MPVAAQEELHQLIQTPMSVIKVELMGQLQATSEEEAGEILPLLVACEQHWAAQAAACPSELPLRTPA